MIKIVTTLKRKPGLSTEAFRTYYESTHRRLGEKYLADYASRYLRRYIEPLPDAMGETSEPDFDVLMEIWFETEADFMACNARLSEPAVAREIEIDEKKLFDRGQKRSYVVEEHESRMERQ